MFFIEFLSNHDYHLIENSDSRSDGRTNPEDDRPKGVENGGEVYEDLIIYWDGPVLHDRRGLVLS